MHQIDENGKLNILFKKLIQYFSFLLFNPKRKIGLNFLYYI